MLRELGKYLIEYFYVPLYLIAWIVAVYRYKRYYDTPLKYFPMLIIYTFFTELLGVLVKYNNNFQFFSDDRYAWHNVIIYNVYQLIFFLFFYRVYYKVLKNESAKKLIKYASYLCIFSYVLNSITYNPLHNKLNYAHIVGSLILIVIILFYFKEKRLEKNPQPWRYNLLAWISIGLLVFYVFFPAVLFLGDVNFNINIQFYFRHILLGSIAFMYGCFIIGLLLGKRKAFR